ncbi:MAG: hypothetical protein RL662_2285 [Bacteroidota bacterium]|jgi:glycosyltransferase involved in cell wall biosynthesis
MKISVVINTFNADEFLERVLTSVQGFDEIVICDMYSTDNTVAIAQQFGCKIVYHEQTGIVEPARAYAISEAANDWVLVIDADELVSDQLKSFLYDHTNYRSGIVAVQIPRKNYFMGKFMSSAYPNYLLRFFQKDKVIWSSVIHSHPKIDGNIFTIPKHRKNLALIHLSNDSIKVSTEKMNKYTEFEMTRRSAKSYGYLSLMVEPFIRFMRFYVFKGGFRDGIPGLIWANMAAYYKFISIAKVIESKVKPDSWDDELKF